MGWDDRGHTHALDDLSDVATAGGTTGDVVTRKADGTYDLQAPAGSSAYGDLVPIYLPSASFDDTDGDEVTITLTSVWGVDSNGDPYFDSTNVVSGEEAALLIDPTDGTVHVVEVDETAP